MERQTVYVILGAYYTLPEYPTKKFVGLSFEMQWTAAGQPMDPDLDPYKPQCIERSAQKYNCETLRNWFEGAPRNGGRQGVKSLDPQAFYLPNMEYDTAYCFRFKAENASWTQWSCTTTPSPPANIPAMSRTPVRSNCRAGIPTMSTPCASVR